MMQTFNDAYRDLLSDLLSHGVTETNERTGVEIKMLAGGASFKVALDRLPVAGNRRYWPRVAAAETAWQFMGTQDPAFIMEQAPKIWGKFVEDGRLRTAYGYRWRKHFDRDQLALAMHELVEHPTNRQLYISAWDPATDGLGASDQPKNIPCPVGFSLTRVEDELHCSMFLRSSDVFVGLPYDVMCYALTVGAIAASTGLTPGTLHVTLAHAHIYEPHFEAVEACIHGPHCDWTHGVEPVLPDWTVDMIVKAPGLYVGKVAQLAKQVDNSDWNPMPELVA